MTAQAPTEEGHIAGGVRASGPAGNEPKQPAEEKRPTDYVVLRKVAERTWEEVPGDWKTPNGAGVIARTAAEKIRDKDDEIETVGVPSRSFQPIVVTFETKPIVKVRPAER